MKAHRLSGVFLTTLTAVLVTLMVVFWFVPGAGAGTALADSVRHFSLLAETMQPLDSTIGYDNTLAFLKTTQNSSISASAYIGQLDLPDGARISGVRCFGLDSDPNGEFTFQLFRYNLWTDPVWSPVTDFVRSGLAFSGGKVMLEANVDPAMAVVDNAEFSYGLFLVLPVATSGELGLLRCVVDTSYQVSLATVLRNAPGQ